MKNKILILNLEKFYKKSFQDLKDKYDFEYLNIKITSQDDLDAIKEFMV